jgi:hypothetical protein
MQGDYEAYFNASSYPAGWVPSSPGSGPQPTLRQQQLEQELEAARLRDQSTYAAPNVTSRRFGLTAKACLTLLRIHDGPVRYLIETLVQAPLDEQLNELAVVNPTYPSKLFYGVPGKLVSPRLLRELLTHQAEDDLLLPCPASNVYGIAAWLYSIIDQYANLGFRVPGTYNVYSVLRDTPAKSKALVDQWVERMVKVRKEEEAAKTAAAAKEAAGEAATAGTREDIREHRKRVSADAASMMANLEDAAGSRSLGASPIQIALVAKADKATRKAQKAIAEADSAAAAAKRKALVANAKAAKAANLQKAAAEGAEAEVAAAHKARDARHRRTMSH